MFMALPINVLNVINFIYVHVGILLIADSEEEFFPEEVKKLSRDVSMHGLSVIVMAGVYLQI